MSRPSPKRALVALRKMLRRRRAPGPSEQQWLRLILLVRRLQRGQFAVAQRLDDIRALTGAMGSFRSDFGALHEQLGAARESAGELERGLSERLKRLDSLPDPSQEKAALERRIGTLDELTARLERLAGQAPTAASLAGEVGPVLTRLTELASRLEAVHEVQCASGGQDELAHLYERIQDLAEGLAQANPSSAGHDGAPPAIDHTDELARMGEQLEGLAAAVLAWSANANSRAQEEALERMERLLETGLEPRGGGAGSDELHGLVERLEGLAERLEQAPVGLPELPPESIATDPVGQHELEELRVSLIYEQEAHRQLDADLAALRERLRGSELARVELETRHSTEMAQMADHVGNQLRRVEDDLKKKKRGLAELTQQNIILQTKLGQLQTELDRFTKAEPPPPLPRGRKAAPESPLEQPREGSREAEE